MFISSNFSFLSSFPPVQEENIDFFFKQLEQIKWEKDKPNEPQIEIRKLLKAIYKKYDPPPPPPPSTP